MCARRWSGHDILGVRRGLPQALGGPATSLAYQPNTVLISNGFAAMGFALPAAIAAKLLHPERRVVAVSGDGGFLMNVQELETACRLGLGVVNVIFRDGAYNLIQWKQHSRYGRETGVTFANPDFAALAESFGARGYRGLDRRANLPEALSRALAHPGSSVIDVPVDYGENARLTERLGHLVCPIPSPPTVLPTRRRARSGSCRRERSLRRWWWRSSPTARRQRRQLSRRDSFLPQSQASATTDSRGEAPGETRVSS